MRPLYQSLAEETRGWREAGYPCEEYPAVAEILEYQTDPATGGLRFLRRPQLRALETYWYLRLVRGTPHVLDLYRALFPDAPDLLRALGVPAGAFAAAGAEVDALLERIRADDGFVKELRLESVRETLALDYPSYILALAMGAGKTILIGAVVATEFAMAQAYPDGPFVENALVFAPGRTIVESLRELQGVPYDRILPPRLYRDFAATLKLTFTRDGERDVPVIRGSSFNVVVTNTEKIRIRRESIRKGDLGALFSAGQEDEAKEAVANLRLRTIASLPRLAVFSDEAHHTYGQAMGRELKRVRQTVDYLHANSPDLVCVVNTTGTPYHRRQPLRDVVVWYGLSEGIRDGVLKEVSGNIRAYRFDGGGADRFAAEVVRDFFRDYGDVALPDGAPAKIALYFPRNDDLDALRPAIEAALAGVGVPPAVVLRNTSESSKEEVDAFHRLNDPRSPHRVILLVNKGTEGWNCPSLFACALIRTLRSSNNFVLQAATRCLRQVPGNDRKARIYLSADNRSVLDRQLRETYGESVAELDRTAREAVRPAPRTDADPPPVVPEGWCVVERRGLPEGEPLRLERPDDGAGPALTVETLAMAEPGPGRRVLRAVGGAVEIETAGDALDLYTAAQRLASRYRVDIWTVREALLALYAGAGEVPVAHLEGLARQIENRTRRYAAREDGAGGAERSPHTEPAS